MKKIGIINCLEVSKRCSGSGCFKAFNNKSGSFEKYTEEDSELLSFIQCNGCTDNSVKELLIKAEDLKKLGVTTIHLSSCIRSKCPWYNEFIEELSKDFQVEGYTHEKKGKR
ncbi:CGGC domain-containing protein [Clostridium lundense]|uniref:CGGC domain-containing protein n=1 Tax=Clostridium lundense TaxID=319475 RepID=UPI00047FC676|nr:CGGC domain-containing protein [Clostridium lundense]